MAIQRRMAIQGQITIVVLASVRYISNSPFPIPHSQFPKAKVPHLNEKRYITRFGISVFRYSPPDHFG